MFSGSIDRLIDKATSQLLLEPDWESIMMICDSVRQGDTQPKHVIAPLKKKIAQDNPHITIFALGVLESMIKNCGTPVHDEIATKEFMEFVKDIAKNRPDPVKAKILEMIQVWSHAFRNIPSYKIVQDTFNLMKMEGCQFPALKEADALFQSESAPDWKEGDCCHRCRVSFGVMQRKHHCRNCGQIFCAKCSSKSSIIPKYGIEKEVRVCMSCFDNLNAKSGGTAGKDDGELPAEYLASPLAKQSQGPPSRSEQELQEAEELELALALSKSEAESSNPKTRSSGSNRVNTSSSNEGRANDSYTSATVTAPVLDTSDMDPELAHYLNRNYWQQKQETNTTDSSVAVSTTTPSAPVAMTEPKTSQNFKVNERFQNGSDGSDETAFQAALSGSIDIFINRMMSDHQRGRSIYADSSVQTLFQTISQMHPQLIDSTKHLEDERNYYEGLQDKLAQVRDAREALDALRDEHREKRRLEAEEAERQRQIALAQKLDVMRQKKQEYLEYQRQLALQRMQEQERELAERLQHQKQYQYQLSMYNHQYPAPTGLPPGADGSPHHQPYPATYPPGQAYGTMSGVPDGYIPPQGAYPPGAQIPAQYPPAQYPAPATQAGQIPEQLPPGQIPPGQVPPGQMPPGQAPPGQMPSGQMPPGQIPEQLPPQGAQLSAQGQVPPQMAAQGQQPPAQGYIPPGSYNPNMPMQGGPPQQPPPAQHPVQQPPAAQHPGQQPAQQPPPQQHPGQPFPVAAPPAADYNAYNMQNMAGALPGQGAPTYNAPPGGPAGAVPIPQNVDAGAPGQPPVQNEAQLISF